MSQYDGKFARVEDVERAIHHAIDSELRPALAAKDAEIARLTAALAASEAKRVEALEVLRSVEWSATGAVSGVGCCPDCSGYDPAQATNGNEFWHAGYHGNRAGHAEGCALAALLENKGVDRG